MKNIIYLMILMGVLLSNIVHSQIIDQEYITNLIDSISLPNNDRSAFLILYTQDDFGGTPYLIKPEDGAFVDLSESPCLKKKIKSFKLISSTHVSTELGKAQRSKFRVRNWWGNNSVREVSQIELMLYGLHGNSTFINFRYDGDREAINNRTQKPGCN